MSFPYSAASRRQSLSRSAGLSMAAAAVFAVSVSPAAGAGPGCKGDACRVLEPFGPTLAAAGPSCRSWLTQNFWRRARARDVRNCLARGAQVRARGGGGPLHLAAAAGNAAGVKLLLAAGARVDRPTRGGMTALQFAAATRSASAQRRQATVKALLAAGARTGARANKGRWTALHMAAIQGHAGVVKILLAAGADTRLRDRRGRTPLQAAQAARQRGTAQLLASAGRRPSRSATARPGRPDCRGWLTAGFWRRAGTADVRRCLAAGSRVDARTGRGSTPLHWAAYVNNAAAVKALVAAGAKVDARDARNRTPAHSAASGGAGAAVRALIAAGADVSARSADGRTPADEARSKGRTRIAGLLGASGGRTATAAKPQKPADGGAPGKIAEKKRNAGARTGTAAPPARTAAKTADAGRNAGAGRPDCNGWLTKKFWRRAGAADVRRCTATGRRLHAYANGWTPLLLAVDVENAAAVAALVAAGANVEWIDKQGYTPLRIAAYHGKIEMVEALVRAGAKIEAKDRKGRTPLQIAAWRGKTEAVKALVRLGANIEAKDRDGITPLHEAANYGKTEAVKALVRLGANIEAKDRHGYTPLHVAAYHGKTEMAKTLIRLGAKTEARDGQGNTALHVAVWKGKTEAAEALIRLGAKIEAKDREGNTPLHEAAHYGRTEAVEALIRLGANVEATDREGRTALHRATQNRKTEAVAALTRLGAKQPLDCKGWLTVDFWRRAGPADIRHCIREGRRATELVREFRGEHARSAPLHFAAFVNNVPAVKTLLSAHNGRGVATDKNRTVGTPLAVAAKAGSIGAMEALIPAMGSYLGVKLQALALHKAAKFGRIDSVKVLLRVGVKANSKDIYGSTALHGAAEGGNAEVVKALLAAGADVNAAAGRPGGWTALHVASKHGRAEAAKALLAGGANIEAKTEDNRTALSIAENAGNARTASVLTAAGAKAHVSCEDWHGRNWREFWKRAGGADVHRCLAYNVKKYGKKGGIERDTLHLAAVYGRPEAVKALIDAGAKIDAKVHCVSCIPHNGDSGTALHSAVLAGKTGNVKVLVAAGADVTARNLFQLNPLELARASGNPAVLEVLTDARKKLYEQMRSVTQDCGNWAKWDFWKYGSAADVKRCVRAGRKAGARNKDGWTRLHVAAYHGNVEMMKALIASGAKVDAREKDGGTPLHIAAAYGTPGALDVLLDAKANAKAKSRNGISPFDAAKKRNKRVQGTDAYWRLNEALHE